MNKELFEVRDLTQEQIDLINRPDFDDNQRFEIELACKRGVPMDGIELMANSGLDWRQMEQVRIGFQQGLSYGQVQVWADKRFDYSQMDQLRVAQQHGVDVSSFAMPRVSWSEMQAKRLEMEKGLHAGRESLDEKIAGAETIKDSKENDFEIYDYDGQSYKVPLDWLRKFAKSEAEADKYDFESVEDRAVMIMETCDESIVESALEAGVAVLVDKETQQRNNDER